MCLGFVSLKLRRSFQERDCLDERRVSWLSKYFDDYTADNKITKLFVILCCVISFLTSTSKTLVSLDTNFTPSPVTNMLQKQQNMMWKRIYTHTHTHTCTVSKSSMCSASWSQIVICSPSHQLPAASASCFKPCTPLTLTSPSLWPINPLIYTMFMFMHLADAFIQSDLQMKM